MIDKFSSVSNTEPRTQNSEPRTQNPELKIFPIFKLMELLDQEFTQPVFQVPAGFGKRLAAWLIDCILISFAGYVIGLVLGVNIFKESWGIIWFDNILTMVYFIIMEGGNSQATFGKKILNIKVTGLKGEPINYKKAFIRNICKIISALIIGIGFIMVLFTDKKQGLHDLIAETLVVEIN